MEGDLGNDPLLRGVPEVEGFKVLEPCVLYARIGQGGMGTVYRGKHLNLDIDVAVKCLKGSLAAEGPTFVARFQREAKIAASIHHQNLVQVYDISHKNGVHYLVMEYVMGETARDRVKRKGSLSEVEACRILLGAAHGLGEAHGQRIVHRDVKPDNILISQDGKVKVSDLGLAKALESEDASTLTHGVMGTPQYMAPEQWADTASVGPSADVWALGATFYFLLSGNNAIPGGTMQQVYKRICVDPFPDLRTCVPSVSQEVLRMIERCVAKDVRERYRDARELARDLERHLASDHTTLADAASGTHRIEDTLVSPPPPQTMARIRVVIDSKVGLTMPFEPDAKPTVGRSEDGNGNGTGPSRSPKKHGVRATSAPARQSAPEPSVATPQGRGRFGLRSGATAALIVLVVALLYFRGEAGPDDEPKPKPDPPLPAPPAPIPSLGWIEPKAAHDPVFVGEGPFPFRGKLTHPRTRRVAVCLDGAKIRDHDLDGNDVFSGEVLLQSDRRYRLEVFAEGLEEPLRLTLVRDTQDPRLTLLAPIEGFRTRETDVELRVALVEENLLQIAVGDDELTEHAPGEWSSRLPLNGEGANPFRIHAIDRSGNEHRLELTIVMDTTGPHLVSFDPGPEALLVAGAPRRLSLEFDEELSKLTIEGRDIVVDGKHATSELPVGFDNKSLQISLRAFDQLNNELETSLTWSVYVPLRYPIGFEVLDKAAGAGGWARKVLDPQTGIGFVLVDPGSFLMGSPDGRGEPNERPQHEVSIPAPFYLSETEVTQAQWTRVFAVNPSQAKGFDHPVEKVSWLQARDYCSKAGYRLPREAEWEYACRAGTTSDFSNGNTLKGANCADSLASGQKKTMMMLPVRRYAANPWGFLDMHGNVKEWCEDVYAEHSHRELDGGVRPKDTSSPRVLRGGSYLSASSLCRSAFRSEAKPGTAVKDIGFRVAISIP